MKQKFYIVNAARYDASILALKTFVEEFWHMINRIQARDPHHPAIPPLTEEGQILDFIVEAIDGCPIRNKQILNEIFGDDYDILPESTIEKFTFAYQKREPPPNIN